MSFESDTMEHKTRVSIILTNIARNLIARGRTHDNSKFKSPEREIYEEFHKRLTNTKFGSEQYHKLKEDDELKVAINHHYQTNDHHPEHFEEGIVGMNLIQIVEMLADIKAVCDKNGTKSVDQLEGFMREKGIPENYYMIFRNTLEMMEAL